MKKLAVLIAVIAVVFFAAAPSVRAADTIKIGAAFALSGSIAVYGEGFKKCIDLAVEEINAKGGIKGKRSRSSTRTTRATPRTASRPSASSSPSTRSP